VTRTPSRASVAAMRITNSKFVGQTVALDGGQFVGCTFERCTFVFRGAAPVAFEGCAFVDVRWTFDGPAALTVALLRGLWASGGREVVEATLGAAAAPTSRPAN
jgi:hypothetical protein